MCKSCDKIKEMIKALEEELDQLIKEVDQDGVCLETVHEFYSLGLKINRLKKKVEEYAGK